MLAIWRQDRLILLLKQAFFALSGFCRRQKGWRGNDIWKEVLIVYSSDI